MRLAGLWRLVFVLWALGAGLDVLFFGFSAQDAAACPQRRAAALVERARWERLPLCDNWGSRCDQAGRKIGEPYTLECYETPQDDIGRGVVLLAAWSVVIWGGALVVRWVFRGFVTPAR